MSDFLIENGILTKYLGTDKEISIPDGVTIIAADAFRRKGVVRVTMPDTVEEIGWDAFSSCRSLEEVTFSKNLKRILSNAFLNCPNLKRAELFPGLESIGGCAFSGCSRLAELVLPEHPIEIEMHAFSTCHGLADEDGFTVVRGVLYGYTGKYPEKLHVPEGVKHIISSVGWGLYHTRSLSLPASVEHIEDGTFSEIPRLDNCTIAFSVSDPKEAQRLVKRVFSWDVLAWAYLEGHLSACDLIVEALKKQIASKAAREELLADLVCVEDPAPLTRFLGCVKKLPLAELDQAIEDAKAAAARAVLLDYKQKHYSSKKVAKAKQDAEDKELGLKEKTLSDWRKELKITKKGDRYVVTGFKEDPALDAILSGKAPKGVEFTIPAQIGGIPVELGAWAFRNCSYVKTIIIEEGLTKIGALCFDNCWRLRDVYIPASVTDFDDDFALTCFHYGDTFTIHAPAGSKAEELAKKNNQPFAAE